MIIGEFIVGSIALFIVFYLLKLLGSYLKRKEFFYFFDITDDSTWFKDAFGGFLFLLLVTLFLATLLMALLGVWYIGTQVLNILTTL